MIVKSRYLIITLLALANPARGFGAINDAKTILTPGQWAKVPESIKTPGLRRGDGEGPRFERGGPGN
ncbi:MAG: hypothetical protein PVSMB1_11210 [Gemmatimonadaceae bacterium]